MQKLSYYFQLMLEKHTLFVLFFLILLGSHLLDYHLYIFIIAAIFLIHWQYVSNYKITWLILFFILAIYISWFFLDDRILYNIAIFQQVILPGLLIFLMYLLGLSIQIKKENHTLLANKNIFYLLFIFMISYSLFIVWSYFMIPQDIPLTSKGMFVCFPNPYEQAHVNDGRLISTILAYYLTPVTFMLPFILFYFKKFKSQGFYIFELFLLLCLSLFLLYISAMMGRRTVIFLFIIIFLFLFLSSIFKYLNIKKTLLFIATLSIIVYSFSIYLKNKEEIPQFETVISLDNLIIPIVNAPKPFLIYEKLPLLHRVITKGLDDHRFSWWGEAISVMFNHPFGGGNGIYIAPHMKLAHNTWIDIGKDLGILPFVLFIILTLIHSYYLIRIFFAKNIESLLKNQLVVVGLSIFAIMMIEPIFNSDKTFFAYIFFYLGIVTNIYMQSQNKEEPL